MPPGDQGSSANINKTLRDPPGFVSATSGDADGIPANRDAAAGNALFVRIRSSFYAGNFRRSQIDNRTINVDGANIFTDRSADGHVPVWSDSGGYLLRMPGNDRPLKSALASLVSPTVAQLSILTQNQRLQS